MILDFQQGIITYPISSGVQQFLSYDAGYVNLETYDGRVDITFAHGTENYLFTEASSIQHAWGPIPNGVDAWLYWDINTLSAVRTFGVTYLLPVFSTGEPPKVEDQHWFDLNTKRMMVCRGNHWVNVIRVFACKAVGAIFTPANSSSILMPYAGSQVGLSHLTIPITAGRILVDDAGMPIRRASGIFFTTEDEIFVNGSPANTIRLEANILHGTAKENIAKYQVVKFTEFDRVNAARYDDTQTTILAMLMEDLNQEETGTLCMQGVIVNPEWNWTTVGATLWLHGTQGGMLTEDDPHVLDALTYKVGKTPVARVISPTSIFFDQGLGGKGDKGEDGSADVPLATETRFGISKLSLAASDVDNPIVVGDNDPRNFNDRYPLPHNQAATTITTTPVGILTGANVQANLQLINDSFVKKAGDTMTGFLTLSADPSNNLHAATKHYVDSMTLNGLSDVTITSPTNGQALTYSSGTWINSAIPDTTIYYFGSLYDVALTSLSAGQLASYDGSMWVNITPTLSINDDVDITSPTSGQVLKFNGTKWVNDTDVSGGGGDSLWTYSSGTLTPTTNPYDKTAIYSHTLIDSDPIITGYRHWTVIESLTSNDNEETVQYILNSNHLQNSSYYYLGGVLVSNRDLEGPNAGYRQNPRSHITLDDYVDYHDFDRTLACAEDQADPTNTYTLLRVYDYSYGNVLVVVGTDYNRDVLKSFRINPVSSDVLIQNNADICVYGNMIYVAYEAEYSDTGVPQETLVTIVALNANTESVEWSITVPQHLNGPMKVNIGFDPVSNIVICSQYNWMVGLNAADGSWVWSGEIDSNWASGNIKPIELNGNFITLGGNEMMCVGYAESWFITGAYHNILIHLNTLTGEIYRFVTLGLNSMTNFRPYIRLTVGSDEQPVATNFVYAAVGTDGKIWGSLSHHHWGAEATILVHKIDIGTGDILWTKNVRNNTQFTDTLHGFDRSVSIVPLAIKALPSTYAGGDTNILISGLMYNGSAGLG